ncbi:MAG: tryptophan--tRNA ligase, partial [Candidatus Magasanikbacteria bacterium]|nr:tryptophan--tRNA ligase [Candidatus Magasanikbacteria bacterium]
MSKEKDVVLSGIRATGKLHLGNYLGAMRYFVDLSRDPQKQCYFFIANLHTLTTKTDPESIKHDLLEITLDYLAAGINPETSIIFAQSSVPETCELSWLLNCITSISALTILPHFKDKKDKMETLGQSINSGLLTYPVLMAADILGPKATLVPVGEDQYPHVELTRELARRFNFLYGKTFPEPQTLKGEDIRVPGLDGTGKMGKSDNNTIDLIDTQKIIKQKISQAVTDPARIKKTDPGTPEICNIFELHQLMSTGEEIN